MCLGFKSPSSVSDIEMGRILSLFFLTNNQPWKLDLNWRFLSGNGTLNQIRFPCICLLLKGHSKTELILTSEWFEFDPAHKSHCGAHELIRGHSMPLMNRVLKKGPCKAGLKK